MKTLFPVCLPLLLASLILSQPGFAEIYRWRDKDGKLHFSDQPPEQSTAEATEVSDTLQPINRDTSSEEHEKMKQVFPTESAAESRYRETQNNKLRAQQQARQQQCQQSRELLKTLQGPVAFIDDSGEEVVVSEEERQRRAKNLEQEINRLCR